ncbi:MAG TPA: hypothetical protein VD886_13745 [Herpetosiphonaceae bacterium]|nr:hypothetical protein [Herpetosiphonaceae bacterium]
MLIEPAWITTIDHLDQLVAILRQPPALSRIFSRFVIPPGFPFAEIPLGILGSTRRPAVPLASGLMELQPGLITFEARPLRLPGPVVRNLREDMQFVLTAADVLGIERYVGESPFGNNFNMLFARLHTRRGGLMRDFLVCVGGGEPTMDRQRRETSQLIAALLQAVGGA